MNLGLLVRVQAGVAKGLCEGRFLDSRDRGASGGGAAIEVQAPAVAVRHSLERIKHAVTHGFLEGSARSGIHSSVHKALYTHTHLGGGSTLHPLPICRPIANRVGGGKIPRASSSPST